jgi:uncharacterized damage-inducible protein DinB
MSNSKNYIKQFEYELWANELTIQSIKAANEPEERAFKILGHVVASHSIWLDKIKGLKPSVGSWEIVELEKCMELSKINFQNWFVYLSDIKEDELSKVISFPFFGQPAGITIGDLIIHLINHSSYHRGQIISSLKGKLDPLPLTTYIAYAKQFA